MEQEQLLRRMQDLAARCEKTGCITSSTFLTPAEQAAVDAWQRREAPCKILFFGGHPDCERKAAFFLPYYYEEEDFSPEEELRAIQIKASYGTPGHRDYLGALLALGVKREWIGDLWIRDQTAWVFCLPSVAEQLSALTQAGRVSVKASILPLSQVPEPERKRKQISFTVQSLRFDAVLAETFRLSRSGVVKLIAAGLASLNYLPCLKNDAPVKEGDILSLRGYGKACLKDVGGNSRKGRIFVQMEVYL